MKQLFTALNLFTLVFLFILATPAYTQKTQDQGPEESSNPFNATVQRVHDVDANGQLFSYSIAALGGTAALGLSGWLLHARPLERNGTASPLVLTSAIVMAGAGLGQFLHGGMRMGERQASAAAAKILLNNPNTTDLEYVNYLRYRAHLSANTRFIGGVLTTLQAASALGAGLDMALTPDSSHTTAGWVIAGIGLLGTGVGVIHFFGKTRSQRELDKLPQKISQIAVGLTPTAIATPEGELNPGLAMHLNF